jgi:hypothetical protein
MNFSPDYINELYSFTEGLPHLNLRRVEEWIYGNRRGLDAISIWQSIGDIWIEKLCDTLGEPYWILDSKNFFLLTPQQEDDAEAFAVICENALSQIETVLNGISKGNPYGSFPVLIFHEIDSYYRYISHYYPDQGAFAQSGGIFISSGYPHFAFPENENRIMEHVIIHELTHACIYYLSLPRWLDEGLAQRMEEIVLRDNYPTFSIDRELAEKHWAFWNRHKIKKFWIGDSFYDPGDSNQLSYSLSRIMIDLISKDTNAFKKFILNAKSDDNGEAAAKKYLGKNLTQIVADFLGPSIL